ncbi:MAG: TIGR01212 family radical SAM protein [Thermincola sp.]|jgi:radical SAM protein (TIGR01212 family)|nr:TIGR01212 family radical SAM protein [Thermincola sp.]MDT3703188.1 TIGR01212 family radical SAM protein [Thermincola sp.]
MQTGESRYRQYSEYLKKKYGEKVYKLPVNLPGTCPNRDGTVGKGGCIFCDEEGAGFECLPSEMSIAEQIRKNKEFFRQRFNGHKFFVYFQAFTNTYCDFAEFRNNIRTAVDDPDVIGISISTRPDCINDDYLDFLQEIKEQKGIGMNIELGLQTVNYHTLKRINRGHTLAEFLDAVQRIKKRSLDTVVHLILNLPWDEHTDAIESAKICSAMGVEFVKLHSLYIVKDTPLGRMYEKGEFELISLEDYIARVVLFLEYLDSAIIIQRLVGKGPQGNLHFCNWSTSWWKIKQRIDEVMAEQETWQGRKFNYLNGAALKKAGIVKG